MGRIQTRHFRRFRQNPPHFGRGQKHRLPKTPFLQPREVRAILMRGLSLLGGPGFGKTWPPRK